MRLGVIVPNLGPAPTAVGIAAMAEAAERAGAESAWISDHLLFLDQPTTGYPYAPDGVLPLPADVDMFEALVCAATMAAVTRRIRIGTSILVLPQRNVLEVAKTTATLDRLSNGRFALGVGMGWNRAEQAALGYDFATRKQRFTEMLEVLHDCWSGRPSAYQGVEVQVPPDVVLAPRPVQPSGPPLLVGGMGPSSLALAASHGDGWMAIAFADSWDPERLAEQLTTVRSQRRAAAPGRSFESLLKLHWAPSDRAAIPHVVAEAASLGFDEILVDVPWLDGLESGEQFIRMVRKAASQDQPAG